MPLAKKDTLYFKRASKLNPEEPLAWDDGFEVSLIEAPDKYLAKVKNHHEAQGYILVGHDTEMIKLPNKYNGLWWFSVGGIFGSVVSAIGTAFLYSLR